MKLDHNSFFPKRFIPKLLAHMILDDVTPQMIGVRCQAYSLDITVLIAILLHDVSLTYVALQK